MNTGRRCPVCHKPVRPTHDDNIAGHRDGMSGDCPMSGEPYTLAELISDAPEVISAKAVLQRAGYVVLRRKSWLTQLRRHAIAESERDWEKREADRTRQWAQQELCGEIRSLRERVTYLYGVARARGASHAELGGNVKAVS